MRLHGTIARKTGIFFFPAPHPFKILPCCMISRLYRSGYKTQTLACSCVPTVLFLSGGRLCGRIKNNFDPLEHFCLYLYTFFISPKTVICNSVKTVKGSKLKTVKRTFCKRRRSQINSCCYKPVIRKLI